MTSTPQYLCQCNSMNNTAILDCDKERILLVVRHVLLVTSWLAWAVISRQCMATIGRLYSILFGHIQLAGLHNLATTTVDWYQYCFVSIHYGQGPLYYEPLVTADCYKQT